MIFPTPIEFVKTIITNLLLRSIVGNFQRIFKKLLLSTVMTRSLSIFDDDHSFRLTLPHINRRTYGVKKFFVIYLKLLVHSYFFILSSSLGLDKYNVLLPFFRNNLLTRNKVF